MPSSASPRRGSARLTIGQVSRLTGVPVATLRFYEAQRLVFPASRTAAGYRLYSEDSVEELRFVSKAKSLGMPLRAIGAILAVARDGQTTCEHVLELVRGQIRQVDIRLARLGELRRQLSELERQLEDRPAGQRRDQVCPCLEGLAVTEPMTNGTPEFRQP